MALAFGARCPCSNATLMPLPPFLLFLHFFRASVSFFVRLCHSFTLYDSVHRPDAERQVGVQPTPPLTSGDVAGGASQSRAAPPEGGGLPSGDTAIGSSRDRPALRVVGSEAARQRPWKRRSGNRAPMGPRVTVTDSISPRVPRRVLGTPPTMRRFPT